MKFSNNGIFLLSVSRDRSFKLFKRQNETTENEPANFEMVKFISSKNPYHTRIIWSCDWSHDDKYFVTTSRDKKVCIWSSEMKETCFTEESPVISDNNQKSLELECAVTASSFAPELTNNGRFVSMISELLVLNFDCLIYF